MSVLHGIFAFALEKKYVKSNIVGSVKRPEASTDPEVRFLNLAELEALHRTPPDTPLGNVDRTLYLVGANTGLRQGELLGLRWRNVDWMARRVRVVRNFVRGEHGSPKSGKGRSVPMSETVARELERHFKRSRFNGDDDFVFCHPETGKELERSRLLKRFKAAVLKADIGEFEDRKRKSGDIERFPLTRFHDLRHTFGTTCAAAGIPLRTLQEWMGHVDIKTTMIYAHYAPGEEEAALIERAFTRILSTSPQSVLNLKMVRHGRIGSHKFKQA